MAHEDAGHYRAKHPQGTSPDPAIAAALTERAVDGRVGCRAAHEVAATLQVAPSEVGKTADLLEYRIVECQLGLFGYSPDKRVVKPADEVTPGLRDRLGRAAAEGTIDCASCWKIAETLALEKMAVSSACELLGLKITHCQLGAF